MRLRASILLLCLIGCSTERSLRQACERGDPGACDVLSARLAYGDGIHQDADAGAAFAARAMELCAKPENASSPGCNRFRVASVPLDLPPPSRGAEVQTVLSVILTFDGSVIVDEKKLPNDDALLSLAKEAQRKSPEIRAVIKADAQVSHGRVIHVLDLLKQAGIGKIAFGVVPVAPTPAAPR